MTEFEGVPAKAVLEAVGASGTTVVANAINDYQSRIPLSDFTDYAVLLAFKVNGKILTRRDKGPLWIVYPMDDHPPKFRSIWSNRSVWQMNELVVE